MQGTGMDLEKRLVRTENPQINSVIKLIHFLTNRFINM